MSRRPSFWFARAGAGLLVLALGCASPKPPASRFEALPLRTLTTAELAASINRDAVAVTALKGKLDLEMRASPGDPLRHCRGVIAARSPWVAGGRPGLFLEGYRQLIPTLFTLVSDGREFWLLVPHDNIAYTGQLDGPHPVRHGREIRLDVADLFRALFVAPIDAHDSLSVAEVDSLYAVAFHRAGRVQRELWIERRGLTAQREIYRDPQGAARLEIDREAYAEIGGRPFPMRLRLRDVRSGSLVQLDFGSVTLEPPALDERLFQPKIPPGTEIRTAGEVKS